MRTGAVIVAAGSGDRLGAGVPKAFVRAAGLPLVTWSVRAFEDARDVTAIVIVCPPGQEREMSAAIGTHGMVHAIVPGGSSRQRSVAAGIAALPHDVGAILVHDADADTLKRADAQGNVDATVDRAGLWGAQTPQVFRAHVIRSVFASADDAELDSATDCAGMAERRGIGVAMLDPGAPNMKVTTQADLRLVEVLLGSGRIA